MAIPIAVKEEPLLEDEPQDLAPLRAEFAATGQVETLVDERRHAREGRSLLLPAPEVGGRGRVLVPAIRIDLPQQTDPVRAGVGERAQKQLVDDRVDGRVRADPEREGEHRDRGETPVPGEDARTVADVLHERLDHPAAADAVRHVPETVEIAEAPERRPARLGRRHSFFDVRLRLHLDVEAHLFVDIPEDGLATEKAMHARREKIEQSHGRPTHQVACRTLAMARTRRSQFSSSASSCFLPDLVIE